MPSTFNREMALGACALAMAWGTATAGPYADLTATAQLSNLKITVVDLDPHDGVEADFRFVDGPFLGSSRVFLHGRVRGNRAARIRESVGNKDFGSVEAAKDSIGSAVEAVTHAQVVAGAGTMALPASLLAKQNSAYYFINGNRDVDFSASASMRSQDPWAPPDTMGRFVVTANTRVTFEALAEAAVDVDLTNDPVKWGTTSVSVGTSAGLWMYGDLYDAAGGPNHIEVRDVRGSAVGGLSDCTPLRHNLSQCSDQSDAWRELLTVSLETGAGQEFRGDIGASIRAYGGVSTIPESGTWVLLLMGLAAVGAIARRNRTTT